MTYIGGILARMLRRRDANTRPAKTVDTVRILIRDGYSRADGYGWCVEVEDVRRILVGSYVVAFSTMEKTSAIMLVVDVIGNWVRLSPNCTFTDFWAKSAEEQRRFRPLGGDYLIVPA